jgi:hypothetical protein
VAVIVAVQDPTSPAQAPVALFTNEICGTWGQEVQSWPLVQPSPFQTEMVGVAPKVAVRTSPFGQRLTPLLLVSPHCTEAAAAQLVA